MQLRIHDLLLIAKYNPPEQAKHVIFVQFEQLAITFVMPENLIELHRSQVCVTELGE